jgi:hypothetical protein
LPPSYFDGVAVPSVTPRGERQRRGSVPEGVIGAQSSTRDVAVAQIVAAAIALFNAAVFAIGCSYLKEGMNSLGPVKTGNLKREDDVDRLGTLNVALMPVARAESPERYSKQGGQRRAGFVDET